MASAMSFFLYHSFPCSIFQIDANDDMIPLSFYSHFVSGPKAARHLGFRKLYITKSNPARQKSISP